MVTEERFVLLKRRVDALERKVREIELVISVMSKAQEAIAQIEKEPAKLPKTNGQ